MLPPVSRLNPPSRRVGLSRFPHLRIPSARTLSSFGLAGALTFGLSACSTVVLDPAGDVAKQQGNLVLLAFGLMLLIVIPVMAAVVYFAWKYRASNTKAKYDPDWDHSTHLELMIWTAPLLIIICLGAVTWTSTHLLDPYRTLSRIDKETGVAAQTQTLEVQVVALDWKWLFIYPEQGIATVNELVLPTNRPVSFKITSASVMNSFFLPAMAGQVYAMPGMETRLHGVLNKPGQFTGLSANYSGHGFSNMRFVANSVTEQEFAQWAASVKAGGENSIGTLDRSVYLQLEKPSEKVPATRYSSVSADLYSAILDMCVEPGKMCNSEMMAIDAAGGLGRAGISNVSMLTYDKTGRQAAASVNNNPDEKLSRELAWVRALCEQMPGSVLDGTVHAPTDLRSLVGAGLPAPQSTGSSKGGAVAPLTPAAPSEQPAHVSQISRN